MTRNFLEGARRKRISYTPLGLYEAWRDLNAAKKVYFGTLVGLVLSVCVSFKCSNVQIINCGSFCPRSCSSLARVASMIPMVSSESPPIILSAAEEVNGMLCQQIYEVLRLTVIQDSLNIRTAVLDNDRWPVDIMEDPQHQGRPLMGLANETCHHCWVRAFVLHTFYIAYIVFSLPGTPLWIAFTYSKMHQIQEINRFFAPAGW
jgi:hypothetical protein